MLVVESKIRNFSSQKFLYCIIVLSMLCFFVLFLKHGIFYEVIDIRDLPSLFLLCFGIISVIIVSSITHILLLFSFEYFVSKESTNILNQLKNHLEGNGCLCFLLCLDIVGCCLGYLYLNEELQLQLDYILVFISTSMLFACITILADYDDVDLSSSQTMEKSIGASWALGAYLAFYKKILIDITKRMSKFEEKEGIKLLVKKLVIICPLSCNVNGTLEGKDGEMEIIGSLEEIIDDEGAVINKRLKINVYKIRGEPETYVAAEFSSPLATLYEMRDTIESVILDYHRDCFIATLKDRTKSENCEIIEYDDINSPEPLHSFLLSKFQDKKLNTDEMKC